MKLNWDSPRVLVVRVAESVELTCDSSEVVEVEAGETVRFLLMPGGLGQYEFFGQEMLAYATPGSPLIAVVTRNFLESVKMQQQVHAARTSGQIAGIVRLDEVVEELGTEVMERLKLSRSTAHEPPEPRE
jgi:hypothetical protein